MTKPERVLVTGARGFIGSACLAALAATGLDVHAVTSSPDRVDNGTRWHQADLLALDRVERLLTDVRPTHLLHLAWFVRPGVYWTSPVNLEWVGASLALVQRFAEVGGQRAVLVGTGAEYHPRFRMCNEDGTPLGPATLYGASKAALSLLLPSFAAHHGLLNTVWARIFSVYGPGEPPTRLVPSTIQALLRSDRIACTSGRQVRDSLYVSDVADALIALLGSSVTGAVNIGSGRGTSVRTLVSRLGSIMGREDLLDFGALEPRPGEPLEQIADVTRLNREVGYTATVALHDGLQRTVDWWRERQQV